MKIPGIDAADEALNEFKTNLSSEWSVRPLPRSEQSKVIDKSFKVDVMLYLGDDTFNTAASPDSYSFRLLLSAVKFDLSAWSRFKEILYSVVCLACEISADSL